MESVNEAIDIEQTLYICPEVHLFRLPPRSDAGGYRSGEWLVSDKIFTGRLRLSSLGKDIILKIEDPMNQELFAMVKTDSGTRNLCIEKAIDSSRYFVIKVQDQATARHAFLGMGFDERGDSFDFNAALDDHEKQLKRAEAVKSEDVTSNAELSALYKNQGNLGLKEGETIRVNIDKTKIKKTKVTTTSPTLNFKMPMLRSSSMTSKEGKDDSNNNLSDISKDYEVTKNWTTFN